jgi:hypothetical protein
MGAPGTAGDRAGGDDLEGRLAAAEHALEEYRRRVEADARRRVADLEQTIAEDQHAARRAETERRRAARVDRAAGRFVRPDHPRPAPVPLDVSHLSAYRIRPL